MIRPCPWAGDDPYAMLLHMSHGYCSACTPQRAGIQEEYIKEVAVWARDQHGYKRGEYWMSLVLSQTFDGTMSTRYVATARNALNKLYASRVRHKNRGKNHPCKVSGPSPS
jgi:hypothetical protein